MPQRSRPITLPLTPVTIVPLALALGAIMHSAEDAVLVAANIGGDGDSIVSIAGGVLGARYSDTVNDARYAVVSDVK